MMPSLRSRHKLTQVKQKNAKPPQSFESCLKKEKSFLTLAEQACKGEHVDAEAIKKQFIALGFKTFEAEKENDICFGGSKSFSASEAIDKFQRLERELERLRA